MASTSGVKCMRVACLAEVACAGAVAAEHLQERLAQDLAELLHVELKDLGRLLPLLCSAPHAAVP